MTRILMNQPVPMRCHFHGGFEPCMLRGTNLSLTITTWPRVLADFNFDCVIGPSRVPAKLMQAWGIGRKEEGFGRMSFETDIQIDIFQPSEVCIKSRIMQDFQEYGKNQTLV